MGILIAVVLAGYLLHHGRHYARNRRSGLSVLVSMRGPWGTRISRRF